MQYTNLEHRRIDVSDELDEALTSLGLVGPFEQFEYVSAMEQRFGRAGARFMDQVDKAIAKGERGAAIRKAYRLMAGNPEMAAYVSAHQYSHLYRLVGEFVLRNASLFGDRVLDVGCGVGLLTLLLGRLLPHSQITGIDRLEETVRAARLIQRDRLANVCFASRGLDELARARVPYETILALFVTHEMFEDYFAPDASSGVPSIEELARARLLASNLADEGALITINRFPSAAIQTARLDALFGQVGLIPRGCDESSIRLSHGAGNGETFPVRIFRKGTPEAAPRASSSC